MNEKMLRRIIREEIGSVMVEVSKGVPDTFTTFRKKLNTATKKIPELWDLLSSDMRDTGYEGDLVQPMWNSWMELEYELEAAKKNKEDVWSVWEEMLPDVLHDMFIDLGDELKNPWNFPPGADIEEIDSARIGELGHQVAMIMLGTNPELAKKRLEISAAALRPVVTAVIDDLDAEGAGVEADIRDTFATLVVTVQRGVHVSEATKFVDEGFTTGRYGPKFSSTTEQEHPGDPGDAYYTWKSANIIAWLDDVQARSFTLMFDYQD